MKKPRVEVEVEVHRLKRGAENCKDVREESGESETCL